MLRSSLLTLTGFVLACGLARAADPVPPAGFWKISIPTRGGEILLMVAFTEQDGKWVGDYLTSSQNLGAEPKFKSVKINRDKVQFVLELNGRELLSFDGVLAKDKKKIAGSMSMLGSELALTELYPTKLRKLDDPVDIARDSLPQIEGGPLLFEAAGLVLSKAAEKKLTVDEVGAILDRVNKAAAGYGQRWERDITTRIAEVLASQQGFADVAVAQAKRAERLLTDEDSASTRLKVIGTIATALTKAGKADEAKQYQAQMAKLEARDLADYTKSFPFKTQPYAGRKGKSDRAVLVELFTGAECPPCVAADLAFDGLMKTYKPADVVLLQYHIHVPGPDPLTSPDSMRRVEEYYSKEITGAPTVIIGGKPGPAGGGSAAAAEKKYTALREQIEEGLEKAPEVKLSLAIARGEKDGFTAKAAVSDLAKPGEKMMLRFALVEETIRYAGGNGVRYHHLVVRSMPGGIKGFPLTKKSMEQSVSFDPEELRKTLTKYLDDFAKNESPFPRPDRPLALKNLKLIAFVQNDESREVLHAVQVNVDPMTQ